MSKSASAPRHEGKVLSRFPDAPPQIAALPVDARGYPVPWFVPWINGEPRFEAVRPERIHIAHKHKACWICGGKLGGSFAFVVGPMCCVNRVSSEPPSHIACARFAAHACPFLTRPLAKRAPTPAAIAGSCTAPAGIMLERNPGVCVVWQTNSYRFLREPDGRRGLFAMGSPLHVDWLSNGREATRAEIIESIETGLPALADIAKLDGKAGEAALAQAITRAVKLVPAE